MNTASITHPTPVPAHPTGTANTRAALAAGQIRFGFRINRATVAAEWLRLDAMCIAAVSGVALAMVRHGFEDFIPTHAACVA